MDTLRFTTYNLHNFKNDALFAKQIFNCTDLLGLYVQEHWLPEKNMDLLNLVDDRFVSYGVSSMLNIDENTVMHGRPFSGVVFLWRAEISANVSIIGSDNLHRCIAIQIAFEQFNLLCFWLYLPCFATNEDYEVTILQVTAYIESIIMQHDDDENCRILSDFCSFVCVLSHSA